VQTLVAIADGVNNSCNLVNKSQSCFYITVLLEQIRVSGNFPLSLAKNDAQLFGSVQ
jgi:hypothetical protein